jgi:hypothetical protein
MTGPTIFEIWLMAFVTLAIFSFLYRDNPVYRLVEHVFAGTSAGYYIGVVWKSIIIQQLWDPLTDATGPDTRFLLIIPGILGCLMFTRLIPKLSWISRIALAFVMGNTAGVFLFSQLHGLVLPQMQNTMTLRMSGDGSLDIILTAVVVVGVVSTLIYFYFSHEHKGALGVTAKVGIWFIMVSFGAHFGYTVMARVSLLIGRVQFLVEDWIGSFL